MKGKYKRKRERQKATTQLNIPAMDTREPQEHSRHEESQSETSNRNKKESDLMKWWHEPSHIIQCVGIGVGIIVATIYFCQLVAMQDQVKLSRSAMKIDQRAWVQMTTNIPKLTTKDEVNKWLSVANGIDVIGEPEFDERSPSVQIKISFKLENFGKSPAIKTVMPAPKLVLSGPHLPGGWNAVSCAEGQSASFDETNAGLSYTVFPGDGGEVSLSEIPLSVHDQSARGLWIEICIAYRDTIGTQIHRTHLLYKAVEIPNATPRPFPHSPQFTYWPISRFELKNIQAD